MPHIQIICLKPYLSKRPRLTSGDKPNSPVWLLLCVTILGFFLAENCFGTEPATQSGRSWNAGVELRLTSPYFSEDQAILRTEEDLFANTRIRDFQFDYDTTATPRFWVEYQSAYDIGIRASAWFLNSDSARITLSPPANGFGELNTPTLFGIDLASVIPGDQIDAQSALEIASIDLEITRRADFCAWELEFSAGLRHARIDQSKSWTLRNAIGDVAGTAAWNQENSGWGPTVQLASFRPIAERTGLLEASLRTSLLRMTKAVSLLGQEDLDLPTSFTTDVFFENGYWIPVIEARLGTQWSLQAIRIPSWCIGAGYETQWFADVGTPSDSGADLGVHGLFLSISRTW